MRKSVFHAAAMLVLLAGQVALAGSTAFYPVDIYIDSGDRPLAAYQLEYLYDVSSTTLVGVEGGEAPFDDAPYYDPAGLKADRIVIAAYTMHEDPPRGRVHVARLHLLVEGRPARSPSARLILTAGEDGVKYEAAVEVLVDPEKEYE